MNVEKLKKLILENHPEINLIDLGLSGIKKYPDKVKFSTIVEKEVAAKYYVKGDFIKNMLATGEFKDKFLCLKTKRLL